MQCESNIEMTNVLPALVHHEWSAPNKGQDGLTRFDIKWVEMLNLPLFGWVDILVGQLAKHLEK